MNDSLKYNRGMLRKKPSLKELYRDELLKANEQNINVNHIRQRVRERITRSKNRDRFAQLVIIVILILIVTVIAIALSTRNSAIKESKPVSTTQLFKPVVYSKENGVELKVEYYKGGPKAAETLMKNGLKHQQSESYYESGEQFRSALYHYDSLIIDIFFYKNGDTIRNFPDFNDGKIHRIKLTNDKLGALIKFDFFDGKIIKDTYSEQPLN